MDRQAFVSNRAKNRCEYCGMHQSLQGATFHVEHIVPRSEGGSDKMDNLAWVCPSCNLHKSDRVSVQPPGLRNPARLFNPRTDDWLTHFEWDDYSIVGRSEIGIATIEVLDLNYERRIKTRQAEQLFGLFPPNDD